jgi:FixJ family two-component response regulator
MEAGKEMVYVVDDEPSAGQDLSSLLRARGKGVRMFTSMRDFLDFHSEDSCACLIVGPKMLGTGREAQKLISNTSIRHIYHWSGRHLNGSECHKGRSD